MLTSGTTAVATNSDTAVTLVDNSDGKIYRHAQIINEGAVAGFFSIDGGTTWCRLPASSAVTLDNLQESGTIKVKRIASGSDLASVYGFAW